MAKETSASPAQQEAGDMRPMAIQSSAALMTANKSPWMRTIMSPWFLIPLSMAGLALLAVVFRPNALQGGDGIQGNGKEMGHTGSGGGGMYMGKNNKNDGQMAQPEEEDPSMDEDDESFVPTLITAEKGLLDYYKGL